MNEAVPHRLPAAPSVCDLCDRAALCLGRTPDQRAALLKQGRAAAIGVTTGLVLCSDHPILRSAVRLLIDARPQYRVLVETANCPHALQHVSDLGVDLALIEFDLTDNSPERLRSLEALLGAVPRLPVLILTADPDAAACRSALQAGAKGLILKNRSGDDLFGAIDRVRRGENWLEGPALVKLLAESGAPKRICPEDLRIAQLTKREREIVQVVARGHSNRQVAQQLCISGDTVRHHLSAIFGKLGVATRGELIVYAYRHHLAEDFSLGR